jgi:hypothetical protein
LRAPILTTLAARIDVPESGDGIDVDGRIELAMMVVAELPPSALSEVNLLMSHVESVGASPQAGQNFKRRDRNRAPGAPATRSALAIRLDVDKLRPVVAISRLEAQLAAGRLLEPLAAPSFRPAGDGSTQTTLGRVRRMG